jgi:hypothetical protein
MLFLYPCVYDLGNICALGRPRLESACGGCLSFWQFACHQGCHGHQGMNEVSLSPVAISNSIQGPNKVGVCPQRPTSRVSSLPLWKFAIGSPLISEQKDIGDWSWHFYMFSWIVLHEVGSTSRNGISSEVWIEEGTLFQICLWSANDSGKLWLALQLCVINAHRVLRIGTQSCGWLWHSVKNKMLSTFIACSLQMLTFLWQVASVSFWSPGTAVSHAYKRSEVNHTTEN